MPAASNATSVASDGVALASTTWSVGGGPHVMAVHATGFCKEVYAPIVEELAHGGVAATLTAMDQRGHGDSGAPSPPFDWWELARDVLAVLGGRTDVIGLGHSSGGAALTMAELLAPGTFAALLLVEPIVFPGEADPAKSAGLAAAATRRRNSFESPEAAMEHWRDRGPFRDWDPRSLAAYARGGLRCAGDHWELKCAPAVEAAFYSSSTRHGAFERLGELDLPVHLMAGEHSDTHQRPLLDALAASIRSVTVEVVPGVGHFLPMQRPGVVAARLGAVIDQRLGIAPR